jgi:hypothetical protein
MIVAPQLSSGWRHNYSSKTRQAVYVFYYVYALAAYLFISVSQAQK